MKGSILIRLFSILLIAGTVEVAGQPVHQYAPGRVLVKFRETVAAASAESILAQMGAKGSKKLDGIDLHVVDLPEQANEEAVVEALSRHNDVEYAELDVMMPPGAITPNDPLHSGQWHLNRIAAPNAWQSTTGTGSIIIAILDTGVYASHEDLSPKLVSGWNVYDNNSNTSDVHGHGTTTAGTAAAATNNSLGVSSVAWGCWIMPVRISGPDGWASYSAIANGLTWAADHGARVANISYAATGSSTVRSAADYFARKGGVVVVSAGNAGTFETISDDPNIVTVGGTDENDNLYSWSNRGNHIDLVAPGCVGSTTLNGGGYGGACGTSYSAPIVAGVAALLLSKDPGLSPSQVIRILKDNADDLGSAGWDSTFGSGRVNAGRAMASIAGTADTTAPSVTFQSPGAGATVSGSVGVSASASDNVGVASVTFYVDGNQFASVTSAPYSAFLNSNTLANGSHTLTATARDAAGNAQTAALSISVNNDTQTPSVSFTAPAAGATVSGSVDVSATASDNVAVTSVTFAVDGSQFGSDTAAPYTAVLNAGSLSSGTHTLTATARDAAGNTQTATISITVAVLDTQAPTVSFTSPSNGAAVSGTITVSATASDNVGVSNVTFSVDGSPFGGSTIAPYSSSLNTSTLSAGSHTLTATARDAAGNTKTANISISISDTQPPTVSLTAPGNGATVSGSISVSASASDNVGVASVAFSVDGNQFANDTASPFSASLNTTTLSNGTHTLAATARDAAGNSVTTSITVTVSNTATADTQPPQVSITSPASGSTVSGTVNFAANATDNVGIASVVFLINNTTIATRTTGPFSISVDTTPYAGQTVTFAVRATDTSGNVSNASASVSVAAASPAPSSDTVAPTVAITSPSDGQNVNGNVQVTVSASDNVGVTAVDLLVDGTLVATTTEAPYTLRWRPRKGTFRLQARARDAAGNVGWSQVVTVQ